MSVHQKEKPYRVLESVHANYRETELWISCVLISLFNVKQSNEVLATVGKKSSGSPKSGNVTSVYQSRVKALHCRTYTRTLRTLRTSIIAIQTGDKSSMKSIRNRRTLVLSPGSGWRSSLFQQELNTTTRWEMHPYDHGMNGIHLSLFSVRERLRIAERKTVDIGK